MVTMQLDKKYIGVKIALKKAQCCFFYYFLFFEYQIKIT